MELNQIRYFLEVAKNQHITKSAELLHIAQPALTKSIHRLEEELGVKLFSPKGRGIILTEYGKYLQEKFIPIIESLDSVTEEIKQLEHHENTTIHLNVHAASALITEAVIQFQKENENINFQFTQSLDDDLFNIDVSTKLFYQVPEYEYDSTFVSTEKIYLAVPASHRLSERDKVKLSDLSKEGFISLMGSKELRWICDQFCHHAGFDPKIIFESDSPSAVQNMIAANMGIGFWPEYTWGKVNSDNIKLLEISEPLCQRDIIIRLNNERMNPPSKEFYDYLINFCNNAQQNS